MGLLDKAKETISKATETAKDKIDDVKDRRKVDDLLEELGKIVYRQRTERAAPGDDDDAVRLVAELQALETEGVAVLGEPPDDTGGSLPPPPPPSGPGPLPPPSAPQ